MRQHRRECACVVRCNEGLGVSQVRTGLMGDIPDRVDGCTLVASRTGRCAMPWLETEPMTERLRFVSESLAGLYSMRELCQRYGISRKTGYKWLARYHEAGPPGLGDRSHTPRYCPHRTSAEVEHVLVAARKQHPQWGPRKLSTGCDHAGPIWIFLHPVPSARCWHARGWLLRADAGVVGAILVRPPASSTLQMNSGPRISRASSIPVMARSATRSPSPTSSPATSCVARPCPPFALSRHGPCSNGSSVSWGFLTLFAPTTASPSPPPAFTACASSTSGGSVSSPVKRTVEN